eukprot:6481720-Amphidinium_carterae.1
MDCFEAAQRTNHEGACSGSRMMAGSRTSHSSLKTAMEQEAKFKEAAEGSARMESVPEENLADGGKQTV